MQRARTDEAKDERRRAILAAALDEFFERGFAAARMDDIAGRAGISKGALYLYFDSKEALFTALVDTIAVPKVARLEQFAALPSATAAIRAFLGFAPDVLRNSPLPKIIKVLIAESGAFPEVVAHYRRNVIERAFGALTRVLEQGRDSGELDVRDPHLTARLIAAPIVLSAIWRMVFETDADQPLDIDALFAEHERLLLNALGAKDGGAS